MTTPTASRGAFASRLGFILAAAGSAIGLGNIWRFPYTAGANGGGAFVLVYVLFVLGIGVPVLLAELAMGRAAQRNPVGAFRILSGSRSWSLVGGLGVVTGFGILAFYSVVAGWTLGYLWKALTGDFERRITADESSRIFSELIGTAGPAIGLTALFLIVTVLVVRGGVQAGIERASKILMPMFFLLLLVLAARSLTLSGADEGVAFLLQADFGKLTPRVILGALGQALFSLSLGMGAMITYGSYLGKSENLAFAGATVAVFDTAIALLSGLIVFPALFSSGLDPAAGPGLVFVVLPTIFDAMPAGSFFAVAFYALLAIAALTSAMSLLEVVVAYFVDEWGWARRWAVWAIGAVTFVLAIPSALSTGASPFLSTMLGDRGGFLDLQNILFGNFALSIGALFTLLFVGWRWSVARALEEMHASGDRLPAPRLWGVLVRYVCPVAVLLVLGFMLVTGEFF